jgi:amino acid transporter
MQYVSWILMMLYAILCMAIAHELCYTDTTLGGPLPFLLLTFGPLVGFFLGAVAWREMKP